MNIEPKCPYCQGVLDKMPTRKKMCPYCQNFIFVRNGNLVTEKEAKEIDERWRIVAKLKDFNILEKQYEDRKKELTEKFKMEPKPFDVLWSLANEQITKIKDSKALSHHYEQMAYLLNEEGKDSSDVLQLSRKFELEALKKEGRKKVQILTSYASCPSCLENQDKIMTINEALESTILPNKNCTHILYDTNRGFCRCRYNAYYEYDHEDEREMLKIEIPKEKKRPLANKDVKKTGCLLGAILIIVIILTCPQSLYHP